MTPKQRAWQWCSKYCRLRDAIEYQKQYPEVDLGWVKCSTCNRIVHIKKNADAGHCINRGSRGASGVYFDERNISTQCKICNAFEGGRQAEHEKYIIRKYGQKVLDELYVLDRIQSYKGKYMAIELMYREMYEALLKEQK